jgi:hypothetical protein
MGKIFDECDDVQKSVEQTVQGLSVLKPQYLF